jgi:hypothetical protein
MPLCRFSRNHRAPPKSQQQWGAKQVCEQLNRDACTKRALQTNKPKKWQCCLAKPGATGFAQAALSKSITSLIKSH